MELSIKLKQHSPIIHFQHYESGATLRASALKPKIDKFIINDLKKVDKELYEQYKDLIENSSIFKGDKESKDKNSKQNNESKKTYYRYGISIMRSDKCIKDKPKCTGEPPASYFAKDSKKTCFSSDLIELKIKSFGKDLINLVNKALPYVLTYENFGLRATKGSGCYHLEEDMTAEKFEKLALKKYKTIYKLKGDFSNYDDALEKIQQFYQLLKSGNRNKKSLLLQYMCTKNIVWEKQRIKEKFPEVGIKKHVDCGHKNDKPRYIRAVLGLAKINEYGRQNPKQKIEIASHKKNKDKPKYQRLASPIVFKVFNSSVYLLPNRTYDNILRKWFEFSLGEEKFLIKTPEKFDIDAFLQFAEKESGRLKIIRRENGI